MRTLASVALGPVVVCIVAVAVGADERQAAESWVAAALLGGSPSAGGGPVGLDVRRQDHGNLETRRSIIKTPLRIGEKAYQRGLGSHSVSEVVVRLPRPGREFRADVGVDNNHDTGGARGSVVFVVEVGGKEVARTDVCRCGQAPVSLCVPLGGASQFSLRVLDGGDGQSHDHGDWADASVTLEDGQRIWLDDLPRVAPAAGLGPAVPVSFTYGGKPSADLLPAWTRTVRDGPPADGRRRHTVAWVDPATGLEVCCEVTVFTEFPAAEWVVRLRNGGAADTPLIEDIRPLDVRIAAPGDGPIVLHYSHGSTCAATDFLPVDDTVAPGATIDLAPAGGRSSNGRLPFFNLEWPNGGLVGAIGWSGQWALQLRRDAGRNLFVRAGQQTTRLVLRPGETIRTPRILLVWWEGADRLRGHNLLRRLLVAHYLPRLQGRHVMPPIAHNTWFLYNEGNQTTEANQLAEIEVEPTLGIEAFWLDAGWFEGGWPSGVGSWVPKKESFPRGLKPLGDAAHQRGMKFVVWFEPERVNPGSRIAKEHPEFVLRTGGGDGLFNLGDPAARAWLADLLAARISEYGIDIYRNDFNIDPLPFWTAADPPDRKGMTEIRYVEGLYALWDDLLARRPGLVIDNCSSGGRRIDLETISRSLPLWRSDTQCCGRAVPVQDQVQTAGLSLYVPLHCSGAWGFDPYTFRSIATAGTNICTNIRSADLPRDLARQAIAEAKALRPLYLGDYYPLADISLDERHWAAWQFDRPDLGRGMAIFFRRRLSPYPLFQAVLRGLDPEARYRVTWFETYRPDRTAEMSGADLARLRVEISASPGSLLVTYERLRP